MELVLVKRGWSVIKTRHQSKNNWGMLVLASMVMVLTADAAMAATTMTLGTMASNIIGSFTSLTKLITAGSYLAGMGFSVAAIMKFKQHKDNPTQIPVGTPIALIFIAAALLFLPTILGITGATMFGSGGGTVGGPTGTVFTGS